MPYSPSYSVEPVTGKLRSKLTPWRLTVLLAVIITAYLALGPLLFLVQGAFVGDEGFTVSGFSRAFREDSQAIPMLGNTFSYAIYSTILAVGLGTVLAYLQVRTDAPFRGLLFSASLMPLIIPGILYTPAWVFLASKNIGLLNTLVFVPILGRPLLDVYSMSGMILVHALHSVPIAFLFMVGAFRGMDPSLEESALVSGATRAQVVRRITLPLLRPALVAALLLLFVQGIESFEVPALLGIQSGIYVFTSRIYLAARTFPVDFGAVGALAFVLLGIAMFATLLSWWLVKDGARFQTIGGKAFRPSRVHITGPARYLVAVSIGFFFIVTAVLPLSALVYASLLPSYLRPSRAAIAAMSFDNFVEIAGMPIVIDATVNSLFLGAMAATVVMALTAVVAWVVTRTKMRGRHAIDALALTPLVMPGVVLGLALLIIYLRVPLAIYGTLAILLIAYCTQYLPFGMRFSTAALAQVSNQLEEAALVSGAGQIAVFRRILLPLMASGLIAGWLFVLIHSLRSLSSVILLYSPGDETLAILIFQLYQNGQFTTLAAIGVSVIVVTFLLTALAYRLGSRKAVGSD